MHDRPVSDGDLVVNGRRMGVSHDVDDRAVLDVGPPADSDGVHVAAHDHVHPDAAFLADGHVADDLRRRVHERALVDDWQPALMCPKHSIDFNAPRTSRSAPSGT